MCRINNFIPILTLLMHISSNEAGRRTCGGTYTAARGILATPNFPGPFDVPIRCQWVIDSSSAAYGSGNTSIIVYFTQLFTFEGLTFTEYQLYGNDYKINPKLIHKVNETNVFRTRWVQSYQSYLVIELKMQSSESAHICVLDKFLDTYGFNITYEITTGGVRSPSCTMMDCGFTGICFDHYT
uniref:CUB domain-containing protein n=1 Tax=Dendroctonus ponderosae TaxID=77166 RepID=A0AAR5P0P7_DENPD